MKKNNHAYRDLSADNMEELFSNFLIESWSYSKVDSFSRNEKAFEMNYIYCNPFRRSASAAAGSAYHDALENYFENKKNDVIVDIIDLQQIVFNYIDDMKVKDWKLQKTTPSIDECKQKAAKNANVLLTHFFEEISVYNDDIKKILEVEIYLDEFITVNGVDIPLPCHMKIDMVVETTEGKIAVIDHKSKAKFSDEKELKFSIGKQAMTYVHGYEEFSGKKVDEVWFVENKSSKNKDKSAQLICFKIELDNDIRRLYDAMLYEPLKRMLEAVQDPDYVYLINESDNFIDKAEMYEFWAQTMIAEVDDFNVPESKKDIIEKRLRKIRDSSLANIDPKTIKKFRENASEFIKYDLTNKKMTKEEKIVHVLRTLDINVNVAHKFDGYSSDTFLLEVSAGTNLSKVYKYKLDIANALNVSSIRMMKDLYVYEGKSYLAVESSKKREKDLMFDVKYLDGMKIPIGIDNFGEVVFWDLDNQSTPHVLMCGATGSGKSVEIISMLEYARAAGVNDIHIFDPKFEFTKYNGTGVNVYNDIEEIETMMELLVEDMNQRVKQGKNHKTLVIFDEFADAVSTSKKGNALNIYEDKVVGNYKNGAPKFKRECVGTKKSLEENLKLLLQKGRSSGFRVIAATQRASVKVISGDAKVNFPVQICFRVPKEIDSKVVLDEAGAESLAGRGDGLINSPEYLGLVRFQAFYKA